MTPEILSLAGENSETLLSSTLSWEPKRINDVVEDAIKCSLTLSKLSHQPQCLVHQKSSTNLEIAKGFVKNAAVAMECIGHLLKIQLIDNTFTLHRLIIACASFTNRNDLWNNLDQSISNTTVLKAIENLVTICKTTPWSISDNLHSKAGSSLKDKSRYIITVPGSFSINIIQIIDKELRPCFTHVKAQKIVDRAQTTISFHQEKLRQLEAPKFEDEKDHLTSITVTGNTDLVRQQQQSNPTSSQRIKIAPVTDTPNDEEEAWPALDEESNNSGVQITGQPNSWNKSFLGSVPVVEWCAQQTIQDPSRIHEVFMLLVGPILTMTEAPQYRHRIRGLDLLTGFLIRYYDQTGLSNFTHKVVDSRIWIKIFEKTGLDQVLERSLKPLLGPLQVALTQNPPNSSGDDNIEQGDNNDELEAINAAFRAYLTIILVNTEQNELPTSELERPHITIGSLDSDKPLTVENLFIHAVLGSFKRANPSKEYRTLILEWAKILIRPIIPIDFLRNYVQRQQGFLNVEPVTEESNIQGEQRFQGIYGMGSITIKYLPTLIQYTCDILDFLFPSSPPSERLKSLDLACRASDVLFEIMDVSSARVPRYRGKILASISNCWANSRIFTLENNNLAKDESSTGKLLSKAQLRIDQSLIKSMQLCIRICKPKVSEDSKNGLELDLEVLRGLDPSVFDPLFATE
ncbi:hypothetical protein BGZ76_006071 [Entomortierella beljakovae]|nr:hypothetical protein BGZ76_006071 [Entomortierella beljakovae]